ncbi:hypothetical protein [Tepidibacter hydrothermalis]|uniref:Uncharacterized protein n=1 Tax=Tepidibacter hydrothermalis TaxID=3036126 RepID=A0ABY8EES4_9FIRM|nr:hypothetical protein [Tepidibacter hydrothermalis]WFD11281.1 hypothetical protein P4S50_04175 [Tepidibacter hydrothermalis]
MSVFTFDVAVKSTPQNRVEVTITSGTLAKGFTYYFIATANDGTDTYYGETHKMDLTAEAADIDLSTANEALPIIPLDPDFAGSITADNVSVYISYK